MTTSTSVERRRLRARLALLSCTTTLALGIAMPAAAQLVTPAPVRQSVDGNGVDLFLGTMNVDAPGLTLGQGDPQGLAYHRLNRGIGWTDNMTATLTLSGTVLTVSLGGVSDSFTLSGSTYTATQGNGATLTFTSATNVYTYVRSDGTLIHFSKNRASPAPYYADQGRVTDIVAPSGAKLTFAYDSASYCTWTKSSSGADICTQHGTSYRISTVRNSYGYQLAFTYQANEVDPDFTDYSQVEAWSTTTAVTGANLASASGGSTSSESFGYASSGGILSYVVTDALGRTTKYRAGAQSILGVTRPGSTSEDVTVGYDGAGKVASIATLAGTTSYAYADASGVRTTTVTDALSHATTYTFDLTTQRMQTMVDAIGNATSDPAHHTTRWAYDTRGRVTKVTKPEGNYVQTTYQSDDRDNVTETRAVAKAGSGVADIVASASYPATCANAVTCNQPTSTTDARLNVTGYTYDPTHGDVLTVTAPAAVQGGTQPQTRYSYTALQAYFRNASGSIVASGEPVTRLTGTSSCVTGASCAGTANEIVSSIDYGPQSVGIGNNLLPISTSSGSGDGLLSATTRYTYDDVGNTVSVDGPLPGTDDVTSYRYDAARQLVSAISPDPDGSSAMKRRAERIGHDPHGLVHTVEIGTVNGTSDSDVAAFVSLQQATSDHDAADRKVKDTLSAGGTTYTVTQYSYDGASRLECTAQRMNSGAWSSLPASACTLGVTGTFGPDRIAKTTYDAAGRATKAQSAYGTSDQADDATGSYNNNNTLATLTDANGNTTSYSYDGDDRLLQTRYPVPAKGAGTSSATDYEQLTYDAGSNVTDRLLRDGTHIGYGYDALGRLVTKDLPGSELDVSYSYDLLGRPVSAATSGQTLSFGYDALGRNLTQGGPLGTVTSAYDLGGRRTHLTWPDAFHVDYDYLVTGEMTVVRENGATSGASVLATFSYDDLGRRTNLVRGNGTSTVPNYDTASRLTGLHLSFASTGAQHDVTFGYNPANQIVSTTRSNDAYAWTGAYNRNDASSINGLNQVVTVGADSASHDARGNLTALGSKVYTYSSENLLLTGPSSASLIYDPLLRLYQESGANVSATRFLYDGQSIIGEKDASGTLQKRYVHGPGTDEPLVEYDAGGNRTWLHADERGSIIARSDASGTVTATNSYDEYGVPEINNVGRFGYTGQAWLRSLALWDYKARMYSPNLGRFMQTDPIGYGDGLNWYGYVGGDPVNGRDPSGLNCGGFTDASGDAAGSLPDCTVTGSKKSQTLTNDSGSSGVSGFGGFGSSGASGTGFGGSNGGGRAATPLVPPAPQSKPCPKQSQSIAAQIASWADTTGKVADGVAVASGTLGLITAPTGAGFAIFEGTALLAGGVGRVASVVSIGANLIDGNLSGAGQSAASFIGGSAGGFAVKGLLSRSIAAGRIFGNLSASQARATSLAGDGTAALYGVAIDRLGC